MCQLGGALVPTLGRIFTVTLRRQDSLSAKRRSEEKIEGREEGLKRRRTCVEETVVQATKPKC
jgi:hypothetical protein